MKKRIEAKNWFQIDRAGSLDQLFIAVAVTSAAHADCCCCCWSCIGDAVGAVVELETRTRTSACSRSGPVARSWRHRTAAEIEPGSCWQLASAETSSCCCCCCCCYRGRAVVAVVVAGMKWRMRKRRRTRASATECAERSGCATAVEIAAVAVVAGAAVAEQE